MSFTFNWNSFNEENFYARAKKLLTDALNKSNKPPIIVDKIVVKDLSLGKSPPDLEILEIGDLATDRFRGIFKLNYSGDASITLSTKVQANPLNVYATNSADFARPDFVGASSSLAMPLILTLSEIKLSGIIILVYSKANGLTLVFRNDPLESIKVRSSFDALPGIAKFLQVQIENQIRLLFREELPAILHKLSHKWTPNGAIVQTPVSMSSPSSPKVKPVSLVEINPDMPALSPQNMLRLDTLMASQRTLSLFTPSIPDVISRSNLEQFERKSRQVFDERGIESFTAETDYSDIVRIQSKNFARTSHQKPKRRVIRINRPKKKEEHEQEAEISNEHEIPSLDLRDQSVVATPTKHVPAVPISMSPLKQDSSTPVSTKSQQPITALQWGTTAAAPSRKHKDLRRSVKGFFTANRLDVPPPYTLA